MNKQLKAAVKRANQWRTDYGPTIVATIAMVGIVWLVFHLVTHWKPDLLTNDSFWGVVAGALIWIPASVLTSGLSTVNERKQNAFTREHELRKETYLNASAAVSAAIDSTMRLGNINLPDEEVNSEFTKRSASLAQTHLIGSLELIQALQKFSTGYAEAVYKLFPLRANLKAKANQINILQTQLQLTTNQQTNTAEQMRAFNLNQIRDAGRWDALVFSFNDEQARIVDLTNQREVQIGELRRLELEFFLAAAEEVDRIAKLAAEALVCARHDLGMELDHETYLSKMETGRAIQKTAFIDYLRALETQQPKTLIANPPPERQ